MPEPVRLEPHRVTARRELLPGLFTLEFERRHDFRPGQVVAVSSDPDLEPRLYSLASGADEPVMRLLFDVKPGGRLTPWLARCEPGDSLLASAPFGQFEDRPGPAVWIAGGTGIAPFVSMILSGAAEGRELFHGARTAHSFAFRDLFEERLAGRYTRCCSREPAAGAFHGRVTDCIRSRESWPAAPRHLLCGSPDFVVDVREALLARGVPFDRIEAEIYF